MTAAWAGGSILGGLQRQWFACMDGGNIVYQRRWWCRARAAAALAACSDGGACAWTAATVCLDSGGIVGGAGVSVACAVNGWRLVTAAAASAACGDGNMCAWTTATVCQDSVGGGVRGQQAAAVD